MEDWREDQIGKTEADQINTVFANTYKHYCKQTMLFVTPQTCKLKI